MKTGLDRCCFRGDPLGDANYGQGRLCIVPLGEFSFSKYSMPLYTCTLVGILGKFERYIENYANL